MVRALLTVVVAAAALALPAPAAALVPALPIPEIPPPQEPDAIGDPADPEPVAVPPAPRHPFMAPNERSNLHVDAYQTDVHQGPGPLGAGTRRSSTFLEGVCASVTFDGQGNIVTICVGLEGPKLVLLDARTLELLSLFPLPPRIPTTLSIFNDFAGGGYFYLDHRDRAVIPTTTRQIWVVARQGGGFALDRVHDLSRHVPFGDSIISALPDWSGRIWFASTEGRVGWVDPASGDVVVRALGEEIANSFAVDEQDGVYVVTDRALYRLFAGAGAVEVDWSSEYENSGIAKPGQVHAGSGTTPTVMGSEHVAITDNADPMNVVVLSRADGSQVCRVPVFEQGASATDQSLIATHDSIVTENNYGYTGPLSTYDGAVTEPGLARVDLATCSVVWTSREIAPTVVPKLSAATGLVYTYTKPAGNDEDPWYLTALDWDTGATVFKRRAGSGLGFNNNYAPITLGPDGSAYVGVLGGLARLADSPAAASRAGGAATRTARARPRAAPRP